MKYPPNKISAIPTSHLFISSVLKKLEQAKAVNTPAMSKVIHELTSPTVLAMVACCGPMGEKVSIHKNKYLNQKPKTNNGEAIHAHFLIAA